MDAGRLIQPKGLTLDHAREIAEEEGYLKPGSAINDLLNAIDGELRGNKVFTTTDDAANRQRQIARTAGGRSEGARDAAAAAVSEAEEGLGLRLSQEEHDHAARLVGDGMHPEEAIRQATRGTDERVLDADASRQAFGKPGVPAGAEQGGLGVGGGAARARPNEADANFDQAAAGRYEAARGATLEKKQTYSQGVVGKILKPGKGGADYAVQDANVPGALFSGKPSEAADVAAFLKASGPQGHAAVREALVGDLRDKGIIGPDGMVDGKKLQTWMGRHARTVEQIPGLADEFKDLGTAQEAVNRVTLEQAQRIKQYQDGIAKGLLGDAPDTAVHRALNTQSSAQNLSKLIDLAAPNADATDSLKAHVVQFMLDRFAPVGRAGATMENALEPNLDEHSFLNANAYKTWVDANKAPLRRLFGGQGIQNFERVGSALRRAQFPAAAVAGSQTRQNFLNTAAHAVGKHGGQAGGMVLFSLIGEQLAEHLGVEGLLGMMGGPLAMHFINAARAGGIDTVNDLKAAAMLHPEFARALMERIPPDGKVGSLMGRRLLNAMRSLAVVNAEPSTQQETQH